MEVSLTARERIMKMEFGDFMLIMSPTSPSLGIVANYLYLCDKQAEMASMEKTRYGSFRDGKPMSSSISAKR
ncbi:MAG: hypothetical protein UFJ02_09700 [Prevotella sp.]|nr:hypothetical protein [Prevotella sp.]